MNNQDSNKKLIFNPFNILQYFYKNRLTAHVEIVSNFVTWNLYYIDGTLQYADHSLQSLKTLEYYLSRTNPQVATKIVNALKTKQSINNSKLIQVVHLLFQKQLINNEDKNSLIKELTQDALESFLWLKEGEYRRQKLEKTELSNLKNVIGDSAMDISAMVKSVRLRHQLWQKVSRVVSSPYQRPVFINVNDAQKRVPQGKLSARVLTQLSKIVKSNTTIRDIATVLKQDELKVISLLAPYIQGGIVRLQPAIYPYDNLPSVSSTKEKVTQEATPSQKKEVIANNEFSSPVDSSSKEGKYKIICIDDSVTMLDTIKGYLQGDYFEVVTVENPMESLSYLFESKPDLILMDLSMPKINGNRLSQILKSSSMFQNVPIIIVSGNHKMLDSDKMKSIGARDFLPKPFSQVELLKIVNKHLQTQYSEVNQ
ncbi:MAG: response regulator [Cyanobacterium sp.]